ncbi:MAG: DUF1385 domain-containing protein [Caldilineaceae bacterium]|nr:DUF1385 domain-containing protein [Caldilineaceae bacterium]
MKKHYYGGQAVLEGVMMRGRKTMAVAVRNPHNEIVLHEEPLTAGIYTQNWGQWPFVRGLGMLWDALGLGMRALMWSAEVSAQEDKNAQPAEFSVRSRGRRWRPVWDSPWCFSFSSPRWPAAGLPPIFKISR